VGKSLTTLSGYGAHRERHFMIRQLNFAIGTCELYNIPNREDHKVIKFDLLWNFHNVRSLEDVAKKVEYDLRKCGVPIIVSNVLESIFNIPGINMVRHTVKAARHIGGSIFKGVTKVITWLVPGYIPDQNDSAESPKHRKESGMYGNLMKFMTQQEMAGLQNQERQTEEQEKLPESDH
jgi:hypothetical protein